MVVKRVMSFYLRKDWFFNLMPFSKDFYKDLDTVHSFTAKVIKEKRELYRAKHNQSRREECANQMKVEEISENSENISKRKPAFLDSIMELIDSTLSTDQHLQEEIETFMFANKVFEEIQNIFGDCQREPTRKDLHQMHYLDCVIKEIMRIYPSVPYISRKLIHDLELRQKFALMELKIIISTLIRYATIETITKPEDFTLLPMLIIRPSSPIKIKVMSRK